MNINVSQEQGRVPVTVFHIQGRVNMGNAQELEQAARTAHANGMRDLLLDLSEVVSMTSAGLRAIHILYKLLDDKSADSPERVAGSPGAISKSLHLKLLSPPPAIRRVVSIAGFDQFIEIHDTLQEALASF